MSFEGPFSFRQGLSLALSERFEARIGAVKGQTITVPPAHSGGFRSGGRSE